MPSIGDAVLTGATYSAGFPLTLDALCNGIGQVYYGPVVLITDALSYSATDIFAAGFQDNEVGPVLGTGGNTGAGGANFWTLDDLMRAQEKDPASPFKTLPKDAEIIVAMRRSIRVGLNAGAPLEELGVLPDVLHAMTKRDLLDDNVDLLARAARLIRQRPSFTLSVTPAERRQTAVGWWSAPRRRCQRRSAAGRSRAWTSTSTVAPSARSMPKTGRCRPPRWRSGRTGTPRKAVEAQAWDGAGRLVAVCRTTV